MNCGTGIPGHESGIHTAEGFQSEEGEDAELRVQNVSLKGLTLEIHMCICGRRLNRLINSVSTYL